jgi:cell division protein ZapA
MNEPNLVTVQIAGSEYKLRAQATPEYTRECAEYVDRMIKEIRQQGGSLEVERVAILAALALTDQLFQARLEAEKKRTETVDVATTLVAEIERRLQQSGLAASS